MCREQRPARRLSLDYSGSRINGASDRQQTPIPLPNPKPRALREHFVVSLIRSREIAPVQRPVVRHCEDALKVLDLSNGPLSIHFVSISKMGVGIVKRSGVCM